MLEMRYTEFDIEQALRRCLNWGKRGEAIGQNLSENSIVDEVGNRFTSLKKKISYRDRVIAESRETISNQKAIITAKESAINTKDTRIKELEGEIAKLRTSKICHNTRANVVKLSTSLRL